jgi:hypothetical protein
MFEGRKGACIVAGSIEVNTVRVLAEVSETGYKLYPVAEQYLF